MVLAEALLAKLELGLHTRLAKYGIPHIAVVLVEHLTLVDGCGGDNQA